MTDAPDAWRDGACHCGAIRFRVRLAGGLAAARRCSCSLCAMRGAVALSAWADDLAMTEGADILATYRSDTGQAEHHFCPRCGIYTHHRRRSNPDQLGVNAACLGLGPFDFPAVPVMDGRDHPSDTGLRARRLGLLRFEPADGGAEPAG